MNRQLDLDKSDTQVVAETQEEDTSTDTSVDRHPTRRGVRGQENQEEKDL